jgi:hypothetical protein
MNQVFIVEEGSSGDPTVTVGAFFSFESAKARAIEEANNNWGNLDGLETIERDTHQVPFVIRSERCFVRVVKFEVLP